MSKCASHVIILAASCLYKLLKLRNYALPASVSGIIHSETVMNLLASVKTQDNIAHFLVSKFYNLVIYKHAVGGQRKSEILALILLYRTCVQDELLYHIPVHERLTTEEIHLKIMPRAGILNKKIESTLTGLKAHNSTFARIPALTCKAVGAVQITGMSNMKT